MKLKRALIIYILGMVLFTIGSFLPYLTIITFNRVNTSSKIFEFAPDFYQTTIYGYESMLGKLNILIALLVSILFVFGQKQWLKYLLIPLGIVFTTCEFVHFISGFAGFGRPVGDTEEIGFVLMLLGTILLFVSIILKPMRTQKDVFGEF